MLTVCWLSNFTARAARFDSPQFTAFGAGAGEILAAVQIAMIAGLVSHESIEKA
jgi:hypothetical protein